MPNLIAGRQVVPELLQEKFTPQNVAAELKQILSDGPERDRMLAALAEVRDKLKSSGSARGATAIERAADAVLRAVPPTGDR